MLITLYSIGFGCQIIGVVLIVRDIAADIRAANEIRAHPDNAPSEVVQETGNVQIRIGGER